MGNISKKPIFLILIAFVNASSHSAANAGKFKFDCVEVNFTARLVIPNEREIFGSTYNTTYQAYDVPLSDSKVIFGNCGRDMDAIVVNWVDMNNSGGMKLAFTFNRPQNKYTLSEIAFYFSAAIFQRGNYQTLNLFYRGNILEGSMGHPYCPKANYSLPLTNEFGNRSMGTLELFSLCFEAHSQCEDQLFCDYSTKSIIIVSSIIGSVMLASALIGLYCVCRCICGGCCKGEYATL